MGKTVSNRTAVCLPPGFRNCSHFATFTLSVYAFLWHHTLLLRTSVESPKNKGSLLHHHRFMITRKKINNFTMSSNIQSVFLLPQMSQVSGIFRNDDDPVKVLILHFNSRRIYTCARGRFSLQWHCLLEEPWPVGWHFLCMVFELFEPCVS